jgi:hypothetical protein
LNIGGTGARRFPPPWDIEEYDRSSFIVRATTVRRWLTYISRQSPEGTAAKLLTRDEEIARNIANYFVFISRARVGVSGAVKMFLALRGLPSDYENSRDSRAEDHPTFRKR